MNATVFKKNHPKIGARPGTLAIPAGSPPPRIQVVQYDPSGVDCTEVTDIAQLARFKDSERVTWVDVQGLGDETTLRAIAETFHLHPLALEDAVNVPQRAKTEPYEQHQLVIARAPMIDDEGEIEVPQVCFIIEERTLVTFQERYFGFFDAVRGRIESGGGFIRKHGPDYLAYALLDAMVDRYYPIVQQLADQLEELDDLIADNPHPAVIAQVRKIRRKLVILRRIGWPQREAVNAMLREHTPFISEPVHLFLRDTYDHISQIVELIDSSRELASDLAEAYLSHVSHRTNEIMKVLTLMASIFIPLTFVAGIYGMNFEHMPELKYQRGYFVVWGVMLVLATGMLGYFRHRGWIGASPPPDLKKLSRPE